jgi:hypothetical protein
MRRSPKRAVCCRRLFWGHVKTSRVKVAGFKRINDCLLNDKATAGNIDQYGTGLHN